MTTKTKLHIALLVLIFSLAYGYSYFNERIGIWQEISDNEFKKEVIKNYYRTNEDGETREYPSYGEYLSNFKNYLNLSFLSFNHLRFIEYLENVHTIKIDNNIVPYKELGSHKESLIIGLNNIEDLKSLKIFENLTYLEVTTPGLHQINEISIFKKLEVVKLHNTELAYNLDLSAKIGMLDSLAIVHIDHVNDSIETGTEINNQILYGNLLELLENKDYRSFRLDYFLTSGQAYDLMNEYSEKQYLFEPIILYSPDSIKMR